MQLCSCNFALICVLLCRLAIILNNKMMLYCLLWPHFYAMDKLPSFASVCLSCTGSECLFWFLSLSTVVFTSRIACSVQSARVSWLPLLLCSSYSLSAIRTLLNISIWLCDSRAPFGHLLPVSVFRTRTAFLCATFLSLLNLYSCTSVCLDHGNCFVVRPL